MKMPLRLKAYYKYLGLVSKVYTLVSPLSSIGGLIALRGVDKIVRYRSLLRMLTSVEILEVGAGVLSPLAQLRPDTLTLDISLKPGVKLIASASNLPFKDRSFDVVVCLDTIEHLPRRMRDQAIKEMIRVAKKRVIISAPLENGEEFLGRKFDLLFLQWYRKRHKADPPLTTEHLRYIEPYPEEFYSYGFKILPRGNADLWFRCMCIENLLRAEILAIFLLPFSHIYYLVNKNRDDKPPFWGGICVLDKPEDNL